MHLVFEALAMNRRCGATRLLLEDEILAVFRAPSRSRKERNHKTWCLSVSCWCYSLRTTDFRIGNHVEHSLPPRNNLVDVGHHCFAEYCHRNSRHSRGYPRTL